MPKTLTFLLIGVVVVVTARVFGPSAVQDQLNDRLAQLEQYDGRIPDVDFELYAGRVVLVDTTIQRRDAGAGEPVFFLAPRIEVRLDSLLPGARGFEARLDVYNSETNLVRDDGAAGSTPFTQLGLTEDWVDLVDDLVPLPIAAIHIHDARLRLHLGLTDVDGQADSEPADGSGRFVIPVEALNGGLRVNRDAGHFVFDATGQVFGDVPMVLHAEADAAQPARDSSGYWQMDPMPIARVNPVLRRVAGLDAESGTYSGALVVTVSDGAVQGHLKSVMTRVDLLDFSDGGPLNWLVEGFLGAAVNLAGSGDEQRVAVSVPLSGTVSDTQFRSFDAIKDFALGLLPSLADWGESQRLAGEGAKAYLPQDIDRVDRANRADEPYKPDAAPSAD